MEELDLEKIEEELKSKIPLVWDGEVVKRVNELEDEIYEINKRLKSSHSRGWWCVSTWGTTTILNEPTHALQPAKIALIL